MTSPSKFTGLNSFDKRKSKQNATSSRRPSGCSQTYDNVLQKLAVRAILRGIPASSWHSFTTLSIIDIPCGCPPATKLSSFPGATSFRRDRFPTQRWTFFSYSTMPLICTPKARMPSQGTAPRSISKAGGSPQFRATG